MVVLEIFDHFSFQFSQVLFVISLHKTLSDLEIYFLLLIFITTFHKYTFKLKTTKIYLK